MCVDEGARVVMLARGRERLEQQAAELGAMAVVCDVADPNSVRAAFAEVDAAHARTRPRANRAVRLRVPP
jgi:meso-butanediol dehydrogenase / (S,S)-butanediol dehydrogenase / diacetyl reductase